MRVTNGGHLCYLNWQFGEMTRCKQGPYSDRFSGILATKRIMRIPHSIGLWLDHVL
jgi:hypothetical protein